LVDHLASLAVEVRQTALKAFLAGHDDADSIVKALEEIDPAAPPPEPDAENVAGEPRYKLVCAADVICQPVEWLWPDRVPRGMLTMFAGDPKLGKSIVTIAMAADVSRGAALPGGAPPDGPGSVVLLSAEDDLASTIVPRLKAAGADLDRVHILDSIILDNGNEALPSLRSDIDAIENAVKSRGDCRLVVIDPVSAYLGGTDDHRNAELRGVLSPLKRLAERTGAAVVLVSHLNKSAGTNGKYRVSGSIAYVGQCRANFLFVRDRDDPTGRRVLMLANGCNLADNIGTLAYRIEDRGDGPTVEWEAEPVAITVEQALASGTDDSHERQQRKEIDDWLRETLADGPVLAGEIENVAKGSGFSKSALNRSKNSIGAHSKKVGFGKEAKWYWTLSDDDPDRHVIPLRA
jgi:hypothetical protein